MEQQHKPVANPADLKDIKAPDVANLIEVVTPPAAPAAAPAPSATRLPKEGRVDGRTTRIMLSTMKAYSPLISALTYTPGANATSEEAAIALKEMKAVVDRVGRAVEKTCGVDREDPTQAWAVGMIASSVAVHVGRQWRYINEGASLNEDSLAQSISSVLDGDLPQVEGLEFLKAGDDTLLKVAVLRSLAPVMVEVRMLSDYMHEARLAAHLHYSEDEVLARASEDMFKMSVDLVNMLNPNGNEVDRLVIMQSCLGQSGFLYASAMAHEIDNFMADMGEAATSGRLKEALAETPQVYGIDMDAVSASYEEAMMRLGGIAMRFGMEEKKPAPRR
jgi:hypothetical protein